MYYIFYGIVYLLSLLPFRVLYALSDVSAFVMANIIRYRRGIISRNLAIAFPEKTERERVKIRHDFYRRFCDNFIESIKLLSISEAGLQKRFVSDNAGLMNELYAKGKNVTVMLGHFFNWEYANQYYALKVNHDLIVVYMPIHSRIVDRIFLKMRTRFKSHLLSAHHYARDIKKYTHNCFTLVLVGDQNPGAVEKAYWAPFMGRMAPFVTGPEKSARVGNNAVVFCHISRPRRGYYHSHLKLITENARQTEKGFITKEMISHIENSLRQQPANYLWSHNRFKHPFKEAYRKNVI